MVAVGYGNSRLRLAFHYKVYVTVQTGFPKDGRKRAFKIYSSSSLFCLFVFSFIHLLLKIQFVRLKIDLVGTDQLGAFDKRIIRYWLLKSIVFISVPFVCFVCFEFAS